jgi:hypothetical protein
MPVIPAMKNIGRRGLRLTPGKNVKLYLGKNQKQKIVEAMAQVVECKCKALSSNSITTKRKKNSIMYQ